MPKPGDGEFKKGEIIKKQVDHAGPNWAGWGRKNGQITTPRDKSSYVSAKTETTKKRGVFEGSFEINRQKKPLHNDLEQRDGKVQCETKENVHSIGQRRYA